MNSNLEANSDFRAIDHLIKNNNHDAIVINLRVFNRLLTDYPELFSIEGKHIIYRGKNHVYFHNGEDGDIRTKNKSSDWFFKASLTSV